MRWLFTLAYSSAFPSGETDMKHSHQNRDALAFPSHTSTYYGIFRFSVFLKLFLLGRHWVTSGFSECLFHSHAMPLFSAFCFVLTKRRQTAFPSSEERILRGRRMNEHIGLPTGSLVFLLTSFLHVFFIDNVIISPSDHYSMEIGRELAARHRQMLREAASGQNPCPGVSPCRHAFTAIIIYSRHIDEKRFSPSSSLLFFCSLPI